MENFEKIDQYVTGKMSAGEKEAFEQGLHSDPTLRSEVAMQKSIVEAVKKARMAELKGMLSQVPVSGVETALGISMTKIAATIVTAGALVAGSVYYFGQPEHKTQAKTVKDSIFEKIEVPTSSIPVIAPTAGDESTDSSTESPSTEKKKTEASTKKTGQSSSAVKPKIDAFDASEELKGTSQATEKIENHTSRITASRIPVETNDSNKKYPFHYQFAEGSLMLYGTFDKGLYEVLEVNGNTHTLFLYYKDAYYLLNEKQKQITPLQAITDPELISKLKEYRSR
jgi:hypothetical protein